MPSPKAFANVQLADQSPLSAHATDGKGRRLEPPGEDSTSMTPTEIEFAVRALVAGPYDPASFAFDLITIYNTPKVTVSKLKTGQINLANTAGDVLWKKRFYFRSALHRDDVAVIADELLLDPLTAKHNPRFILVTNGIHVHIRDRKVDDTCNVSFSQLDEASDFLLPLAGYERRAPATENPADAKAAKRLAKLYDAILAANPIWSSGNYTHELNLFMTRILFCFYAEDTGIFNVPQLFTNTVARYTNEDGSDMAPLLERLFAVMNQEETERPKGISAVEGRFPYVNGSLFENVLTVPSFSRTARRLFIECGELDWRTINPDIFGSMIQTIAEPGARSEIGMHYTSVTNIMKVLEPLFLNELAEELERAKGSQAKLETFLARLSRIRVFDPACGSGNFLIVAYKELRDLEMRALRRISDISPNNPLRLSGIHLHNFFGIDVVDFACETAKLSLWIAEYQMNASFRELFGTSRPPLPLGKISTIHCNNANRVDWTSICPEDRQAETFICGNPPYQGLNGQSPDQRADIISIVAPILRGDTKVDYVACWLVKLSAYIARDENSKGALVTTNSICQGEQVAFLWPHVFAQGLCIRFAHSSFKWANSASHNAGVTCIIVGISKNSPGARRLYIDSYHIDVPNINAYLIPSAQNIVVTKRKVPISDLPALDQGSQAIDGGHLLLSPSDKDQIVDRYPASATLVRPFYGAQELLNSTPRYALWISERQMELAKSVPPIAERIKRTELYRQTAGMHARRFADTPYRFAFIKHCDKDALAIPQVSSEERYYLQIGLLSGSDVASHMLYVVYDPPPYLFALLSSRLHRIWTQTIAGKLENRLRYSEGLVYNTFPVPDLSLEQRRVLADHSRAILKARSRHAGKTMVWLYNPETMPEDLLEAHRANDAYLEEYVYGRGFKDDTHRLEHLFTMYTRMESSSTAPLLTTGARAARKVRG